MFQPSSAPLLRCALWVAPLFVGVMTPCLSATLSAPVTAQGVRQITRKNVALTAISARVQVLRGRSILATGSADPMTVRRGETKMADGNAQLEVPAGCQARVSVSGEMTLDVYGPSSVEWRSGPDGVGIVFHKLSWADVDVRSGSHKLKLPADWHAVVGRASFHLRSLAGGPTELRLNAGAPISLEWLGDVSHVRPPVTLFPGSSVRLDKPRHEPTESASASQDPSRAWGDEAQGEWPWRQRSDSAAQVREREVLDRETQTLDEIPGSPKGKISLLRAYEVDGSSSVRPLKRRRQEGQTYAQVPIMPLISSEMEIVTRPMDPVEVDRVSVPRRPNTDPKFATEGARAPVAKGSASVKVDVKDVEIVPVPTAQPVGAALPAAKDSANDSAGDAAENVAKPATEMAAEPVQGPVAAPTASVENVKPVPAEPAPNAKKTYVPSDWRGLTRVSLNGVNEVAAERANGVELRLLGAGRTKVFVSSSSASARWCFTPTADYLLSPGSVAVFEENGDLRMSFGEIKEEARSADRPSFSQLVGSVTE